MLFRSHGIEISVRLVDIKTSNIFAYKNENKQTTIIDAYTDSKTISSISTLANRLSQKICHEFPLVNGTVIEKNTKAIVASFDKASLDWPVLIYYQKDPKRNSETGHSFGAEYIILDHNARINYRLNNGYEILTQCHQMAQKPVEVITR